jgi:hypothetical protein
MHDQPVKLLTILCNPEVYYRVRKTSLLYYILSQIIFQSISLHPILLRLILILFCHLLAWVSKVTSSLQVFSLNLYAYLISFVSYRFQPPYLAFGGY